MLPIHESQESSSPIITRAVAAGLRGLPTDNYSFPNWQRALLSTLGTLPQYIGRLAISNFQSFSGLDPASLVKFSIDNLIQTRLMDYSQLPGKYPAVVIGAGMGGAATYLSIALNAPFLPQAFVLTLKKGSKNGDAREYLNRSIDAALEIAENDPRLFTIQHFDPIHDGWLTRYVNHLRFKLVQLPDAYSDFIRRHVQPHGAVVFLEGKAQWLRYRVGERSVFQIGGWGDIQPEEFINGSERITAYAKQAGLKSAHWGLNQNKWPLEIGPESEWGSEPGLADALEFFCNQEGFRFIKITLAHPNDCARLAFAAAKKLLQNEGREPAGTLIECFSQFDSNTAMQTGLLPLWLIFNTTDSVKFLKEMSSAFPLNKPIFFSPLSTFSITPDMAAWHDWENAIGKDFINIGARKSHYPSDTSALLHWASPLHAWAKQNIRPLVARLTADELLELTVRNIAQN